MKINVDFEYKDHDITLLKEKRREDWYIWVRGPDGILCYDGWWKNSANKTLGNALDEATRGAELNK